jgi:hypothetical protein
LTVEEVLTKVTDIIRADGYTAYDLQCVDGLEFLHHIADLHLDTARWGSHRRVIYAFQVDSKTKYIGVTYYSFSGDGDGDPEFEVSEYTAEEITSVNWRPKD